ncbi:c-type cytochrome [Paraburkholderia pallida]|uniref:Cytochrome c n=1 Tax=Paraburkholderia pallida TaxID=2547399 RepID=A0A4P7D941_9BURK|nr:cytochrome c [Paraburkholderia pallida]QBR03730.1 cytochrome c [Paraburkholderia pallida]
MNAKLKRIVAVWAIPSIVGVVLAVTGKTYLPESIASQERRQESVVPPVYFDSVAVTFPSGSSTFPPGDGADIANANCVMCHSTGMVLRQPPLTMTEWRTEIEKMRGSFGAPITADQVDALARYLSTIDGRKSDAVPSGVSNEAS